MTSSITLVPRHFHVPLATIHLPLPSPLHPLDLARPSQWASDPQGWEDNSCPARCGSRYPGTLSPSARAATARVIHCPPIFSRQGAKLAKGRIIFIFLSLLWAKGWLKFETRISKSEIPDQIRSPNNEIRNKSEITLHIRNSKSEIRNKPEAPISKSETNPKIDKTMLDT